MVFEFFNNDDVEFKNTTLKRIAKELRKEFNVSALPVQDTLLDDPERAVLVVALAAANEEQGKKVVDQLQSYVDANSPGRLVHESWLTEEFTE